MSRAVVPSYLSECHALVVDHIERLIPRSRVAPELYDLMRDYPLRDAKGLRPALCIAACRALGGHVDQVLPTAAVLELYHNAFLIHDDVEDGSLVRRGKPTLHEAHGVPVAINVGDAMLALALDPLLDNMQIIGLGKALRVLRVVARMAKESAEGQALELGWVRRNEWLLRDADYWHMVHKKTCWYTFIAPLQIAAIVNGVDAARAHTLRHFANLLGVAFQVQDDVLNLTEDTGGYGKEEAGDLWEGKRTLILLALMRRLPEKERIEVARVLALPRERKSAKDVARIAALVKTTESIEYARGVAARAAAKAASIFDRTRAWIPPSVHRSFFEGLVEYVVQRQR